MTAQIPIAVLHTMSQLLSRWLPPLLLTGRPILASALSELEDEAACRAVVASLLDEGSGVLGWTRGYYRRISNPIGLISSALSAHLRRCREHAARYVLLGDPDYAEDLAQIARAPLALTIRGGPGFAVSNRVVAIVGSRRASPRALDQAYALGALLGELGVAVVSGGAFGCDIFVHRGVVAAARSPNQSMIVFAGGLENLYPRRNHQIFKKLHEQGGAWISERLWSSPALRYDFPIRNRIVSGLSKITVIIEAGLTSGALITAQTALDQGRDVLVMQPDGLDVRAEGNYRLIEDGAPTATNVEDAVFQIIEILNKSSSVGRQTAIC